MQSISVIIVFSVDIRFTLHKYATYFSALLRNSKMQRCPTISGFLIDVHTFLDKIFVQFLTVIWNSWILDSIHDFPNTALWRILLPYLSFCSMLALCSIEYCNNSKWIFDDAIGRGVVSPFERFTSICFAPRNATYRLTDDHIVQFSYFYLRWRGGIRYKRR